MTRDKLKSELGARARRLGFDGCRVTKADLPVKAGRDLDAFLARGYHGSMEWMRTTSHRRRNPHKMWPEARTAIVLGINYGPDHNPLENLEKKRFGNISVYARNRDYHDVIKGRLKELAGWLVSATGSDVKVFVDTAPLMEKPLAAQAGLGWQGKHTNLVSRSHGSWLFIGSILTTANLPVDRPQSDHCGSCRACLDICPTRAFPAPYRLDARKCISYLTIEYGGSIPRHFRKLIGNRIYGCDDCLAICPWNKYAQEAHEQKLKARTDLVFPPLEDLAQLDEAHFRRQFSGSPVKRIGRNRFVRNVLIAMGNSKDTSLAKTVRKCLEEKDPVVRGSAVWALSQLEAPEQFERLRCHALAFETDAAVRAEWQAHDG